MRRESIDDTIDESLEVIVIEAVIHDLGNDIFINQENVTGRTTFKVDVYGILPSDGNLLSEPNRGNGTPGSPKRSDPSYENEQ